MAKAELKIGDKSKISKAKKRPHYVSNKDFLVAMIAYREKILEWKETTNSADPDTRPRVPTYVGECIMKIATHLSHKPNFINYTFREDMICDGIENCLQYIDNFNPDKSSNPFAYFTQIIYYAFLRRIAKEKKLLYIKYKASENVNIFDQTSSKQVGDTTNYNDDIKFGEWTKVHMGQFINDFEENKRRKVKHRSAKQTPLDELFADAPREDAPAAADIQE
jgi:hypothetical protein